METSYPTLRRPKRKLCYLTNKESPSKQCTGPLTLGDVEKMFDDMDSPSPDNKDPLSQSPVLQTFETRTSQCERGASPVPQKGHQTTQPQKRQMGPKKDALHPATTSSSPKLAIDLDIPFKAHMPVKTSSPIGENMGVEELDNEKDQVVSPILFACEGEDEGNEEAKTEPLLIQNPVCNGQVTEGCDDSELECPPSKIVFNKPKMSIHKTKEDGSQQKNADQPVSAVRQEPELVTPKTKSENVHRQQSVKSTCRGKDMTAFLKMLRDVGQPKPTCSRKSLSPVKVPSPPPPEPDDNFHILEDDAPLWFSIPSKATTSKKQKQSRSSTSDKDSSTDKGKKDSPQEQQESEQTISKLGTQPVNEEMKKTKWKEKTNKVIEPGNNDEFSSPEDLPAGGLMGEEKPNKKKKTRRKVPSIESDKEEERAEDEAIPTPKTETKAQKSSGIKRPKPLKDGNEKTKISRVKPFKGGRKGAQACDAVKQTVDVEAGKDRGEPADAEDLGSLPDKEIVNSETQTEKDLAVEKDKPNKLPVVSEGSSSEDGKILRKRKSKQPGQWWLGHQIKEEMNSTDNEPILKKSKLYSQEPIAAVPSPVKAKKGKVTDNLPSPMKSKLYSQEPSAAVPSPVKAKKGKVTDNLPSPMKSKQDSQEPSAAGPSPVKTKKGKVTDNLPSPKKSKQRSQEPSAAGPSPVKTKDRVLKKRNQTQAALSSRQNTNKTEGKKTKGKKTKGNKTKRTRADPGPDEVCDVIRADHFEEQEQQDVPDQDQDLQSSPLDLSNRDHSPNSAAVSPRGHEEQLRAAESARRRRKPPGNWWKVDDMCEDVESISLQQQEPTSQKGRKKLFNKRRTRLGTPKNGNVAVSSTPLGGAPASLLGVKPLSAPKTVKRSLATFKDIFTSVTETPAVVGRRAAGRRSRRKITDRPAEEDAVRTTFSKTNGEILSMEAYEPEGTQNSPPSHETSQDGKCQSEDRLNLLRSGPSSMIDLEQHEENDNLSPMPPNVHSALSVSDLCAPPLKPLVLQRKDKANLKEWFKSLWSIPANKGAEVSPDQFDWYFYQGRAIGFLVDLHCDSFCNGKMLLGSYMKKPLWVDHSATTVFNLLTSSLSVTIDGKETRYNPGQSFMVPCGHAYNIQNVTAQPAVLYFTRILAESSD